MILSKHFIHTTLARIGLGHMFSGSNTSALGTHMMGVGSVVSQNIDQHFIVQIITSQSREIEMLQGWAGEWQ